MSSHDLDKILDDAIDSIRDDRLGDADEKRITDAVWREVAAAKQRHDAEKPAETETVDPEARIRDCEDFQAVIPAYLRRGLSDAKAMLLEDHVGECLPCRKALNHARLRHARPARTEERRSAGPLAVWGWRVAVAAVIFVAFVGVGFKTDVFSIETGGMITIENIEGEILQVTEDGVTPLQPGDTIRTSGGTALRTGKDSRAMVRLEDGSLVEIDERAELAVKNKRPFWALKSRDRVIDLERGSIIVEAEEQIDGKLYVNTDDANVAVVGTTFAVNHGMKGSRVSVIEGEVAVDHSSGSDVLRAGGQTTTGKNLQAVPVADEVAWSANRDRYLAVLSELTRVSREIEQAISGPGIRYSTTLLDRAPADTVIWVGIPNLADTINDSYTLLQQKIADNDLLQDWWNESVRENGFDEDLERMLDEIAAWGDEIGDELAVTVQTDGNGDLREPIVLSTLHRPAGFGEFVRERLNRLSDAVGENRPEIAVIEANGTVPPDADLYVAIRGDLVAITGGHSGRMNPFLDQLHGASPQTFVGSDFHGRLEALYREGVEWVVGIDVASLTDETTEEDNILGLHEMRHIIGERKPKADYTESRVTITYDQPETGLASWLAAPAPMGSLDFFSADANLVAAFAMEKPDVAVRQLLGQLTGGDGERSWFGAAEFDPDANRELIDGVADVIGGEFAFAIDGPLLPTPSWKFVMEVYDPGMMQMTLEWAVGQLNGLAAEHGARGFKIERRGNAYEFVSLDTGLSAHYTFTDGYMVVAATRGLLQRSLQIRDGGFSISDSPRFVSLLPDDSRAHFSAVFYQNLEPVVGPVARQLQGMAEQFDGGQRELISALGGVLRPSLTVAYGEPSSILFVHTTEGGLFSYGLSTLLSIERLSDVTELLDHAARAGGSHAAPASGRPSETPVDEQNRT